MSFLYDHDLRNARTFRQGEVAARFRQEHREWLLERSRVLHAGPSGSSRLVAGLDFLDDSFDPLPSRPLDLIPESRHFRVLEAGYESTGFHFLKLDYVDRDLREQDFNLGSLTSVRVGVSPRLSSTRPMSAPTSSPSIANTANGASVSARVCARATKYSRSASSRCHGALSHTAARRSTSASPTTSSYAAA